MKLTKYRKLIEKKQKNKMTKKQKKTKRNNRNNINSRNSRKHITKGGNQTVIILGEEKDIETTTSLFLYDNNLTSLPRGIGNLKNLENVTLNKNNLTSLPREIGNLEKLKDLYLYSNKLNHLPREIGNLKNLETLSLDNNSLSSLPKNISNLTNLTILRLNNNRLNFLPKNILKLKKLIQLYLNSNHLTCLPPEIGNLTNLEILDLSNNNLTFLPPTMGNLKKLEILDLSNNSLTSLSENIINLTNLTILRLNNNRLNSLPPTIEKLSNLTDLNLSGNQLTTLPPTIDKLSNLEKLNLSGNQLTTLSTTMEDLTKLKELNLSDNQLATIPEKIEKLQSLEKLNLVHNNISYPFPSKIGNLTLVHTEGIYQLIEGREKCLNFNKEEIGESILNDLNRQLQNKCPELSIELDYYYKLPGRLYTYVDYKNTNLSLKKIDDYDNFDYSKTKVLILCLYYEGDCISSIGMYYYHVPYFELNIIEITSYTKEDEQGKKYNKLLRCIVIIICSQLSCNGLKIDYIRSKAENPISAWLLINNFETEIDNIEYQELLKEKNKVNTLTQQDIFNLYQTYPNLSLNILIPLNTINVNRAYQLIEILLTDISNSIICPS